MNKTVHNPELAKHFPTWLKLVYTAFMLVLVPVYWLKYGPTNFLYFCDLALFLTLAGIWRENRLLVSMPAVGILLPQAFWCVDFAVQATGHTLTGMTAYMFDSNRSLFLRGLSLFHGWLPLLLLLLVARLGYDRRALAAWTAVSVVVCLISYFFLPGPSLENAAGLVPCNVNYVWGLSDSVPQSWVPAPWYLALWILGLFALIYLPTHIILQKYFGSTDRLGATRKR